MTVTDDDQIYAYEDGKNGYSFEIATGCQIRRQLSREPRGPRVLMANDENLLLRAWQRGGEERYKTTPRGSRR